MPSQSAFHFFRNHQRDERMCKGISERVLSLLYFSEEKIDHVVVRGIRNARSIFALSYPIIKTLHRIHIGDIIILTARYIEYPTWYTISLDNNWIEIRRKTLLFKEYFPKERRKTHDPLREPKRS